MLNTGKDRKFGRCLGVLLLPVLMFFSPQARAALVVDAATVDGGATTTVAAGGTISLSVTVTTSGGGASNDWGATGWLIANASGSLTCFDHADYTASGTYTETFDITAPATAGTYNVYLVAFRRDNCTGGNSSEFALLSAVTVTGVGLVCETFRDEFGASAYNLQDGSFNWSGDWNEVADDGLPTSGNIYINSNSLRFSGGAQPATPLGSRYIEREADLSAFTSATLSFDYRETGNWEVLDTFEIYASADGGANWTLLQQFVDDQGNSLQSFSVDITPHIATNTRIAFVITADNGGENFYVDNVEIQACRPQVTLDHFRITPQTLAASTCLPNAITIVAEDASNNPITGYTATVDISTSSGNGNWSVNDANNPTIPNPDTDDDGQVDYNFLASDAGDIILDLSNSRAETLTVSVTDAGAGVTSTSAVISFADNVFVITEDPIQVAGRPQSMNIAMWTNDGTNCFNDTSYNYNPQSLDASIDRAGVLPTANDPSIGGVTIPDGPPTASVALDFAAVPGQANFNLDSNDVGQYRLSVIDNTNVHSVGTIVGSSSVLTVRPFGLGVTNIRAGATLNPGGTGPNDDPITDAGADFQATVAGVLWDASDDGDNDGDLDSGVYGDNAVAPGYAWQTTLDVSAAAASFTPDPGTPGSLNNGGIVAGEFINGTFTPTDLQYTEVGSFTLVATADDYLGLPDPRYDLVGDEIVVGRFRPADFEIVNIVGGSFAEACNTFTYIGQEFRYDTAPTFSVRALNALGAPTAQYRDGFNKLGSGSVNISVGADQGTLGTDNMPLQISYSADTLSLTKNPDGSTDYVFGDDRYRHGPATPVEFSKYPVSQVDPFSTDIRPDIQSVNDGEVSTVFTAGTHQVMPAALMMRFGRLRMSNLHGSELSNLDMPAFTEYFEADAWKRGFDDNCTAIADGNLVSSGDPPGLSTPIVLSTPTSVADNIGYRFPAPGAGNVGYVDTRTDLNSANHLWLRYDWDGDSDFDDDPSARATFGIFQGDPVQIYIQQTFQ